MDSYALRSFQDMIQRPPRLGPDSKLVLGDYCGWRVDDKGWPLLFLLWRQARNAASVPLSRYGDRPSERHLAAAMRQCGRCCEKRTCGAVIKGRGPSGRLSLWAQGLADIRADQTFSCPGTFTALPDGADVRCRTNSGGSCRRKIHSLCDIEYTAEEGLRWLWRIRHDPRAHSPKRGQTASSTSEEEP